MPHKSSVSMSWRLKKSKYFLTGTKHDGKIYFPPRNGEEIKLSGKGKIISFTKIHTAPSGFEEYAPYFIGLIKLQEGPVISGQIINKNKVEIGKEVKAVFRKITEDGESGIIQYGTKFEITD